MSAVPPQGGFLSRLGGLFGGGLGSSGMTPEEQAELQRAALFQAGLATLASSQQPGATLGGSLFSGFQAGSGSLQQANQNAMQSKRLKSQDEKEQRLEKQQSDRIKLDQDAAAAKSRERAAGVAGRVATGLSTSKDALRQFQFLSTVPEVQDALSAAQIDPATVTTPEALEDARQRLAALGGIDSGRTTQQSIPADVASYEFYSKLDPEQKQRFLEVKRNSQPFQLGEIEAGKVVFNRVTGQYERATSAEQEAAGRAQVAQSKATATTVGKGVGEAQLDLQRVSDNAAQALKAIADAKASPGFDRIFGLAGAFPNFPGGQAAGAQTRLDQIQGKTFLEAFNSLKGAGQITEIEGLKATNAIARLGQAQSADDARLALDELAEVIAAGETRARQKASGLKQPAQRDFSSMSDDDLLKEIGGG